jgi:hypothetical protein
MRPERLERLGRCPRTTRAGAAGRFGQAHHGGVHAGVEHFGGGLEPGILAVMRQIGP